MASQINANYVRSLENKLKVKEKQLRTKQIDYLKISQPTQKVKAYKEIETLKKEIKSLKTQLKRIKNMYQQKKPAKKGVSNQFVGAMQKGVSRIAAEFNNLLGADGEVLSGPGVNGRLFTDKLVDLLRRGGKTLKHADKMALNGATINSGKSDLEFGGSFFNQKGNRTHKYDKYDKFSHSVDIDYDKPQKYVRGNDKGEFEFVEENSVTIKLNDRNEIDFSLPENQAILKNQHALTEILSKHPEALSTIPTSVIEQNPEIFRQAFIDGVNKNISENNFGVDLNGDELDLAGYYDKMSDIYQSKENERQVTQSARAKFEQVTNNQQTKQPDRVQPVQPNWGQTQPAQRTQTQPSQQTQPTQTQPAQKTQAQQSQPTQTQPAQKTQTQPSQPAQTQPAQKTQAQPSQPSQQTPNYENAKGSYEYKFGQPSQPSQQDQQNKAAEPNQNKPTEKESSTDRNGALMYQKAVMATQKAKVKEFGSYLDLDAMQKDGVMSKDAQGQMLVYGCNNYSAYIKPEFKDSMKQSVFKNMTDLGTEEEFYSMSEEEMARACCEGYSEAFNNLTQAKQGYVNIRDGVTTDIQFDQSEVDAFRQNASPEELKEFDRNISEQEENMMREDPSQVDYKVVEKVSMSEINKIKEENPDQFVKESIDIQDYKKITEELNQDYNL